MSLLRWHGWRIETIADDRGGCDHRSWWLCRSWLWSAAARRSCARRSRRGVLAASGAAMQGLLAITRGLIAIGAGDCARGAEIFRRGESSGARRAAGSAARRAIGAIVGRPFRRRTQFSHDGRRAMTPSCSACAGCLSRRSGAPTGQAPASMPKKQRASRRLYRGRAGGAAIPLRRRRLGRRARDARSQPQERRASTRRLISASARCC